MVFLAALGTLYLRGAHKQGRLAMRRAFEVPAYSYPLGCALLRSEKTLVCSKDRTDVLQQPLQPVYVGYFTDR